jgi:hypothetical protein
MSSVGATCSKTRRTTTGIMGCVFHGRRAISFWRSFLSPRVHAAHGQGSWARQRSPSASCGTPCLASATGAHPKAIQEPRAHGTIAISIDLYSRLMDGMETSAAAKIDQAFAEAKSGNEG